MKFFTFSLISILFNPAALILRVRRSLAVSSIALATEGRSRKLVEGCERLFFQQHYVFFLPIQKYMIIIINHFLWKMLFILFKNLNNLAIFQKNIILR